MLTLRYQDDILLFADALKKSESKENKAFKAY
jgi:hypothetical protein